MDEKSSLLDADHREQARSILGFDQDSLTTVASPEKEFRAGAGLIKSYATPAHHRPVDPRAAPPPPAGAPAATPGRLGLSELRGYPLLSRFIACDRSFFVFRRFDELTARNLLYMQDELCSLSERLDEIDREELVQRGPQDMWNLHSRRHDENASRVQVMREIRTLLKEYQQAITSQASMLALEPAPPAVVQSLSNWLDGNKPTIEEEAAFLSDADDLCSLQGGEKDKDFLEQFIERRWSSKFITTDHRRKAQAAQDDNVYFYSSTSIRRVVRLCLTIMAILLLVGPIFALHFLTSHAVILIVLGIFAFVFAFVLAVGTKSRNAEIFAAMAAYLSVLVAFVANWPSAAGNSTTQRH